MIYFTTELYQIFKDQVILMLLKLPQKRKRSKRPNSFHGSIIRTPYRTSPQVKFLNRAPPSFIISTQQSTSEFDNTHTSGEYMYLSLQRCWGFLDCCSCRKNVYIPKTQNTENCQARFQSQLVSYQNHVSMFLKSASFTEGRRCPKQLLVNSYFNCGDQETMY